MLTPRPNDGSDGYVFFQWLCVRELQVSKLEPKGGESCRLPDLLLANGCCSKRKCRQRSAAVGKRSVRPKPLLEHDKVVARARTPPVS